MTPVSRLMRNRVVKPLRHAAAAGFWAVKLGRRPYQAAALRALRRQQWQAPEDLRALQARKLQRLIEHCYQNVPYYRRVMTERGVRPHHIQSADDLHLLPLLTKAIIRDHTPELQATRGVSQPHRIRENHTGGSTGAPLTFYQDEGYGYWAGMDLVRNYEMCGYALGDPIAFLWGSDYDARTHRTTLGKLRNIASNTLFLDAFDSREADYVAFGRRLAAFRPRLLVGYTSSLVLLAKIVEAHGIRGVLPGAIQSSAEVLTSAHRALLQRTFGCEVFDRYGCREVGNIAHECKAHSGLHVLSDNNLVEILSNGTRVGPGIQGRITITNLNNLAMPFIRYVNGDLGILSDEFCNCGRGLPLMRSVVGRSADIIVSPSGKLLHGEFFTHLFYKVPSVKEFQVVQRSPALLEVSVVPGPGFAEREVTAFLSGLIRDYGDPGFDVRFKVTDHISRSASGKFRFTISDISTYSTGQGAP